MAASKTKGDSASNDEDVKRMKEEIADAVKNLPPMSLMRHVAAVLTLWGFNCIFIALPAVTIYLLVRGVGGSPVCLALLLLLYSTLFVPYDKKEWFVFHNPIWELWIEYFNFKAVIPDHVNKAARNGEKYLIAEFPHGLFPMGEWLAATVLDETSPFRDTRGVGASVCFQLPIVRHLYGWMGIIPATKKHFIAQIAKTHVGVVPGGIAEMMWGTVNRSEHEIIYLKNHKGFVKIAIEAGRPILPAYVFGNTQLLDRVSSGRGLFTRMSRALRTSVFIPYGRWLLPIPYRYPLVWVAGDPVQVPKVKEGEIITQEMVDETHAQVLKSVKKVFDDNKHILGWKHRELEVL